MRNAMPAKTDGNQELLQLSQQLLDAIAQGNWESYEKLCDSSLTAFEPESQGQLVEGLEFHRFYFRLGGVRGPHATTMCQPRVRIMGDVAVVTYGRLNQRIGPDGQATVKGFEETRVWQKQAGTWKNVHFHRSALASQ
jgi:Calcium/calmodulin dependent protein kinase II association domain